MKQSKLFIYSVLAILGLLLASCSSGDKETSKAATTTEHTHKSNQLWTCGMHPEIILDEPGQCPKCGMNLVPVKNSAAEPDGKKAQSGERKVLYWQAPMNPTEIYDKPGKSKMGMDLVPVYEDEVSSGPSVKIDPVTVQNMGVRFAMAQKTDFSRSLRTVGNITYNEEKIYTVSNKISGWIEKLYVNSLGQPVRKGQTLLALYSPKLVTTQQEYLLALKNRDLIGKSSFSQIRDGAESLLKASRQRLAYWDIPESEIKHLEKTRQVRKTLSLQAPESGIILHMNAEEGKFVKAGASLYKIADLSTVWVDVSIYDNETSWIHVGQQAEMTLSYLPGKKFNGRVSYIYPYLDKKARDIKVRLEFKNPGLELKPGMYANIRLKSPVIKGAIVVPTEAVIRSGLRNLVFISRDKGRFEPREVTLGAESEDGRVRILSGLAGNEKIVISAQFLIDSESRLQEAIQKMLAQKSVKPVSKQPSTEAPKKTEAMPDNQQTAPKREVHNTDSKSGMKCGGDMDMSKNSNVKKKNNH